jgi:hypothetical protein
LSSFALGAIDANDETEAEESGVEGGSADWIDDEDALGAEEFDVITRCGDGDLRAGVDCVEFVVDCGVRALIMPALNSIGCLALSCALTSCANCGFKLHHPPRAPPSTGRAAAANTRSSRPRPSTNSAIR